MQTDDTIRAEQDARFFEALQRFTPEQNEKAVTFMLGLHDDATPEVAAAALDALDWFASEQGETPEVVYLRAAISKKIPTPAPVYDDAAAALADVQARGAGHLPVIDSTDPAQLYAALGKPMGSGIPGTKLAAFVKERDARAAGK